MILLHLMHRNILKEQQWDLWLKMSLFQNIAVAVFVKLLAADQSENKVCQTRKVSTHTHTVVWPHLITPDTPKPPLPVLYNGLNELAHLSLGTRDILGWRSWRSGGGVRPVKKKKRPLFSIWMSIWPQLSSSAAHRGHNSPHSADTQGRTMEEGPYKYIRVRRAERRAVVVKTCRRRSSWRKWV